MRVVGEIIINLVSMSVCSGQKGSPAGRTEGSGDIHIVEADAFSSYLVNTGSFNAQQRIFMITDSIPALVIC